MADDRTDAADPDPAELRQVALRDLRQAELRLAQLGARREDTRHNVVADRRPDHPRDHWRHPVARRQHGDEGRHCQDIRPA